MHRNTFLNSPKLLDAYYADRRDPHGGLCRADDGRGGVCRIVRPPAILAGAGSMAGAGWRESRVPAVSAIITAVGALALYISDRTVTEFQPMNINFGIIAPSRVPGASGKANKNLAIANRSLEYIDAPKDRWTIEKRDTGMRIIVDAMGGDNAPGCRWCAGALEAAKEFGRARSFWSAAARISLPGTEGPRAGIRSRTAWSLPMPSDVVDMH